MLTTVQPRLVGLRQRRLRGRLNSKAMRQPDGRSFGRLSAQVVVSHKDGAPAQQELLRFLKQAARGQAYPRKKLDIVCDDATHKDPNARAWLDKDPASPALHPDVKHRG